MRHQPFKTEVRKSFHTVVGEFVEFFLPKEDSGGSVTECIEQDQLIFGHLRNQEALTKAGTLWYKFSFGFTECLAGIRGGMFLHFNRENNLIY